MKQNGLIVNDSILKRHMTVSKTKYSIWPGDTLHCETLGPVSCRTLGNAWSLVSMTTHQCSSAAVWKTGAGVITSPFLKSWLDFFNKKRPHKKARALQKKTLGVEFFLEAAASIGIHSVLIENHWKKVLALRKKCYVDTGPYINLYVVTCSVVKHYVMKRYIVTGNVF